MDIEKNKEKIFETLKEILKSYEAEMIVKSDTEDRYELAAKGEYKVTSERTGKTTLKQEPFFASIIIQSSYVGLYLCGPYVDLDQFKDKDVEDAMSLLKGKSCFHVKYLDENMIEQIKLLFEKNYKFFENNGWL